MKGRPAASGQSGWHGRVAAGDRRYKKFAENRKQRLAGILAHCRWRLHPRLLEGINNTIKVLKRRACGYRDDDCSFLKIPAAFPGIPS